jgi:hypothetical protein
VFVAVGVGGLLFGFRAKTTPTQPWLGGSLPSPTGAPMAWTSPPYGGYSPAGDASQPGLGPVTLKPTMRPWAKLAGVVAVAAFWNGILSIFLWQVVQAWSQDRSGFMEKWFLPVFLMPFVLIGLGLIGGIVYFVLAMFNPRPRVTINCLALPLGSAIELSWVMEGRIHVIQRLRLSLKGREEAHYRRGTRSHVDKETFADWEMTAVNSHADIRSGQVRFSIPRNTMHSLDTGNNKILWHVLLHGVIKGWPDVKEEFAVHVMPAPPSNPIAS